MAAPTLQAQGTVAAVTTGNLAITLPTYAANDIVVITSVGFIPNTTTGANVQSLSSPWTKNSPDVTVITGGLIDEEHACWWARATSASSLGSTVTITRPANWDTGTDGVWAGRAYVIRGCVTTGNPFDEFASTALTNVANPVLPAITVAGGNRLAIIFMTKADNTAVPTAATGYTVGTAAPDTTGTDCNFQTYRQTTSANISTVTPTGGTANAASNGNSAYFEFAFIPDPVTATAAGALGGLSGSGTAVVQHLASGSSAMGGLVGVASAAPKRFASGDAPLGGLAGVATATSKHLVSGAASLGGLAGSASASSSSSASGAAILGGLVASGSAVVTVPAVAVAQLGGLSATADEAFIHYASGEAVLGGLVSAGSATVTPVASGSAQLGGLVASGVAVKSVSAIGSSMLGGLVASASSGVPPEPTPQYPGGGNPWYRKQPVPVRKVAEVEFVPSVISASAVCEVSFTCSAVAQVTWSILEDEAELLLLV